MKSNCLVLFAFICVYLLLSNCNSKNNSVNTINNNVDTTKIDTTKIDTTKADTTKADTTKYLFSMLKTGNSWMYKIYSNHYSIYIDSTIRFITITKSMDSIWFLSIKDSTYYSLFDTVPKISLLYDTIYNKSDTIFGFEDYFYKLSLPFDSVLTAKWNDTIIHYIKRVHTDNSLSIVYAYYIQNIGLDYLLTSHNSPAGGFTIISQLIKFNNDFINIPVNILDKF